MPRLLLTSLALLLCLFFSASANAEARGLRICLWAEAFPQWVFSDFEKETGIKVYSAFFSSEDTLYQRLSKFPDAYDLVECSPSFVFQQMVNQGLVKQIDHTRFPYKLNPQVRTRQFDPEQRYLLPYMWGSLLIAVNPQVIDPKLVKGFADLWNPSIDGNLLIPDDLRSVYSFTMLAHGYSPNDSTPQHQQQAVEKLFELINSNTIIATNNMDALVNGLVGVAVSWNGSVLEAMRQNPRIKVIPPQEGIVLWLDGFFIPAQGRNTDEVYEFLKYIFRPDICARITEDTMYATTNLEAIKLLPKEITHNQLVYLSDADMARSIMEEPLPALLEMENTFWPKLRALAQ